MGSGCVCPFWCERSKDTLDVRWLWTGLTSAAFESEISPPLCRPWVIEGYRPHATVGNLAFQPGSLSPALTLERIITMIALADLVGEGFWKSQKTLDLTSVSTPSRNEHETAVRDGLRAPSFLIDKRAVSHAPSTVLCHLCYASLNHMDGPSQSLSS